MLLASGMIVGEGLVGVAVSGLVAFAVPLSLVNDKFAGGTAVWIGGGAFALSVFLLYRWISRVRF